MLQTFIFNINTVDLPGQVRGEMFLFIYDKHRVFTVINSTITKEIIIINLFLKFSIKLNLRLVKLVNELARIEMSSFYQTLKKNKFLYKKLNKC